MYTANFKKKILYFQTCVEIENQKLKSIKGIMSTNFKMVSEQSLIDSVLIEKI